MIPATSNYLAAEANNAKVPRLALEIDGYGRIFTLGDTGVAGHYHWISAVDDHAIDASDLEGSSSLADFNLYVLDAGRAITADLAGIVLEGRKATVKIGFDGLAYADFTVIFVGVVLSVTQADMDNTYAFTLHDTRQDLAGVVFQLGDDGQPTASEHPRTVAGHPMDILLYVLETELGLTSADVDETKIKAYRDGPMAGMWFDFVLTQAPDAKEFLEKQIMKPLAGYLRQTWDGKKTVQFFQPLPGAITPVATLTDKTIVNLPVPGQADLINVLSMRFDQDGNEYLQEAVNTDDTSVTKYGMQGQQIIESDGLRSAFQAFAIASQTAAAIFARYGDKNPTLGNSSSSAGSNDPLTVFWSLARLEQGDLVYVTHPLVPDRVGGSVGWTNKVFEILKITRKFSDWTVDLVLVDATSPANCGVYKITTDGQAAWTSSSPTDKATLMFMSDATGHYSDASPANVLA